VFEETIDSILTEMMRLPPVPLIVRYLYLTICWLLHGHREKISHNVKLSCRVVRWQSEVRSEDPPRRKCKTPRHQWDRFEASTKSRDNNCSVKLFPQKVEHQIKMLFAHRGWSDVTGPHDTPKYLPPTRQPNRRVHSARCSQTGASISHGWRTRNGGGSKAFF
jgi:hypothetical protein